MIFWEMLHCHYHSFIHLLYPSPLASLYGEQLRSAWQLLSTQCYMLLTVSAMLCSLSVQVLFLTNRSYLYTSLPLRDELIPIFKSFCFVAIGSFYIVEADPLKCSNYWNMPMLPVCNQFIECFSSCCCFLIILANLPTNYNGNLYKP